LFGLFAQVGIVEQMETPRELEERNKSAARGAKDKAVRRELCTILTKGTAAPTSANANYLLSVCGQAGWGRLDAQHLPLPLLI
jgi:DNA mismatch repair protein MSH6